jgi:hypothetical protein
LDGDFVVIALNLEAEGVEAIFNLPGAPAAVQRVRRALELVLGDKAEQFFPAFQKALKDCLDLKDELDRRQRHPSLARKKLQTLRIKAKELYGLLYNVNWCGFDVGQSQDGKSDGNEGFWLISQDLDLVDGSPTDAEFNFYRAFENRLRRLIQLIDEKDRRWTGSIRRKGGGRRKEELTVLATGIYEGLLAVGIQPKSYDTNPFVRIIAYALSITFERRYEIDTAIRLSKLVISRNHSRRVKNLSQKRTVL